MTDIKFRYIWARPPSGAGPYTPSDPKYVQTFVTLNALEHRCAQVKPALYPDTLYTLLAARHLFTGLRADHDRQEVYEGDIVDEGHNYPSVIEWCQLNEAGEGTGWFLHELDPDNPHIWLSTGSSTRIPDQWKVLGNIYMNPEYLRYEETKEVTWLTKQL